MRTELSAADAEKLLREAEETLAQFTQVADFFLPEATAMARTSLVVFDKFWEYQELVTPEQTSRCCPSSTARSRSVASWPIASCISASATCRSGSTKGSRSNDAK